MTASNVTSSSIVFQQHSNDVYRWAYRLLGRHHDALDVAQDVFVRYVQQCEPAAEASAIDDSKPMSSLSAIENPRAWLRRATINRAIDVMRARTSAVAIADQSELTVRHTDELHQAELRQEITLALETLTESQRSVLIAKVFDGMTFAQIAGEQDVAIPTVKTHYLRAVTSLRDRLQRQHLLEGNDS